MKKLVLFTEDPMRSALLKIISLVPAAEVVEDASRADAVIAYSRGQVLKALETTQLPVFQLGMKGDFVQNKRVRHFPATEAFKMLFAVLAE